jgi:hypothetical protein
MTGPALLIWLLSALVTSTVFQNRLDLLEALAYAAVWLVMALVIFAAGYLLSRRGTFTRTFRALAFAQVVTMLQVLSLYKPIEGPVHVGVFIMGVLAIWIGAATAHNLKGWRAALFPLIAILVYILGFILIAALLGGAQFTFQALFADLGIQAQ